MVKVKEDPPMAEPKPSASSSNNSTFTRKPRHPNYVHYHPPLHHFPFHHYCYYSTPENSDPNRCTNGVGTSTPAKFYFGPGFEPQIDPSSYGAGPSRANQGNEHVVLFHVNPGVVISLQVGNHMEVLTGEFYFGNMNTFLLFKCSFDSGQRQNLNTV